MRNDSSFDNVYSAKPSVTWQPLSLALRRRWFMEPFRSRLLALREMISTGKELDLSDFPSIDYETNEGLLNLSDLRGINLNRLVIGRANFSYCCFDHASFRGTTLNQTHLQYSTFQNANFDGSLWMNVQASPIYAPSTKFVSAELLDTFFMQSDLSAADFTDAVLRGVSLASTDLTDANLISTSEVHDCDIWAAHLSDSIENQSWLQVNTLRGKPTLHASSIESPVQDRPHMHVGIPYPFEAFEFPTHLDNLIRNEEIVRAALGPWPQRFIDGERINLSRTPVTPYPAAPDIQKQVAALYGIANPMRRYGVHLRVGPEADYSQIGKKEFIRSTMDAFDDMAKIIADVADKKFDPLSERSTTSGQLIFGRRARPRRKEKPVKPR